MSILILISAQLAVQRPVVPVHIPYQPIIVRQTVERRAEPTIRSCYKERGICANNNGLHVRYGMKTLDRLDVHTSNREDDCLRKCSYVAGVTGCELIWNSKDAGCYAHTAIYITQGNGEGGHACWVFSKCRGKCF